MPAIIVYKEHARCLKAASKEHALSLLCDNLFKLSHSVILLIAKTMPPSDPQMPPPESGNKERRSFVPLTTIIAERNPFVKEKMQQK